MQSKTFAQLKQAFNDRFDEGESQYISDDEAGRLVNEAAAHLHNWLTIQNPMYMYREKDLQVHPRDMTAPLPADYHRVIKVWALDRELEQLSVDDYQGTRPGYYQRGDVIVLCNVGGVGGFPLTVRMGYVPQYVDMIADADTLASAVAPGYDSYIVNLAVINAKVKEEAIITDIIATQNKIEELINQDIISRKLQQRQRVRDVYDWGW